MTVLFGGRSTDYSSEQKSDKTNFSKTDMQRKDDHVVLGRL